MTNSKAVTIRFPSDLFEAARSAKAGEDSFNAFVVESVRARLKELEDQALYDSFTRLAELDGETDVEFAFAAQAEVARTGE